MSKTTKKSVNRQVDRYLKTFNVKEVAVNFDRDNPEISWDEIYQEGESIDNVCSLSGRILSYVELSPPYHGGVLTQVNLVFIH